MAVLMAAVPAHERPRERLAARGAGALTESELLALVLGSGTRNVSALDLAASLLAEYGTLKALATARPEELTAKSGIGAAKAAALVGAFQLGRVVDSGELPVVLRGPDDVAQVARQELEAYAASAFLSLSATRRTDFGERWSCRKVQSTARSFPSARFSTRCFATTAAPSQSPTTTRAGTRDRVVLTDGVRANIARGSRCRRRSLSGSRHRWFGQLGCRGWRLSCGGERLV